MTLPLFEGYLTEEEEEYLIKTPCVYVPLLLAGADGIIDRDEEKKIIGMGAFYKSKINTSTLLGRYYERVYHIPYNKYCREVMHLFLRRNFISTHFEQNQKSTVQSFKKWEIKSLQQKNKVLCIGELLRMNEIYPKLGKEFSYSLFQDFLEVAEIIAKSSGGFLGVGTISKEERDFLSLDFINPHTLNFDSDEYTK
ncbi:MAG: hypothetical protein QM536_08360 [Chitinophagaceae bacterium]|nr:hypothetical protein [Chitinophagaceae bacterium]